MTELDQLIIRLELHAKGINTDLTKFLQQSTPFSMSEHNMNVVGCMSDVLVQYNEALDRLKETQGFQYNSQQDEARNTIQS